MEHLGDGIVELTGASSDEASHAAAAAIARVPGVRAVVNHVWTPSSEVFGPN
jgi:osmotically-inducible protein OsmY